MVIVNLVVVAACAALAARAAVHLCEAALPDPTSPPAAARRPAPAPRPERPRADPGAITARNIFCSTCAPPPPGPAPGDPGAPRRSDLPLQLVATVVAPDGSYASAVLRDTSTGSGPDARGATPLRVVARGGKVAGHPAVVEVIDERRVVVKVHDRLEYIELAGLGAPPPVLAAAGRPRGTAQ
jgi:hypothetical protein